MSIGFQGKVVVITGAGGALGKAYALDFAARGAQVVANDLGGVSAGGGASKGPADATVEAIRAAGGTAVANYDSVTEGEKIVQCALDHFGRVDVLINNAGILRDLSFQKMAPQDFEDLYQVHLLGTFKVCRAAWPHLRDQGFGRIVNTGSAAGIYGNFGQANYSAMKLGIHGLTLTLAAEGRAKNILANTIAPAAMSRLTLTVMTAEQLAAMRAELVSPLVLKLCDPAGTETGGLYEVGGGWIGKLRWQRAAGHHFSPSSPLTPEQVAAEWDAITRFDADATYPTTMAEAFGPYEKVMKGEIR